MYLYYFFFRTFAISVGPINRYHHQGNYVGWRDMRQASSIIRNTHEIYMREITSQLKCDARTKSRNEEKEFLYVFSDRKIVYKSFIFIETV